MKVLKCKTYEEALTKGFIGLNEYIRQSNTGLSKDMLKKIISVYSVSYHLIKAEYEQTRVYEKVKIDYAIKVFFPTIYNRTKMWHNSTLIAGDFMCNKIMYKKYLDGLANG